MRQGSVENPTIRSSDFWSKCSSVTLEFLTSLNPLEEVIKQYFSQFRIDWVRNPKYSHQSSTCFQTKWLLTIRVLIESFYQLVSKENLDKKYTVPKIIKLLRYNFFFTTKSQPIFLKRHNFTIQAQNAYPDLM